MLTHRLVADEDRNLGNIFCAAPRRFHRTLDVGEGIGGLLGGAFRHLLGFGVAAADGGGAGSLNDAQRREIRAIIDELTELKKLLAG